MYYLNGILILLKIIRINLLFLYVLMSFLKFIVQSVYQLREKKKSIKFFDLGLKMKLFFSRGQTKYIREF